MPIGSANVFFFGEKDNISSVKPSYSIELENQIFAVEWAPYDWCQDLICIAFQSFVCVATCKFDIENDKINFNIIHKFPHETIIEHIAWSPQTSLSVIPNVILFCGTSENFEINIFESDLVEKFSKRVLTGHNDYINEVAFESEGRWLASTGDDQTCRIWNIEEDYSCYTIFYLNSPGVSVCWHSEDNGKLLVAEKNSVIQIYNVISQLALFSLDTSETITSAHWCPQDPHRVCAFSGQKLYLWNLNIPNHLIEVNSLHSERGGIVRFNSTGDLIASLSHTGSVLKISHRMIKNIIFSTLLKLTAGLTWHQRLPILTVANDRNLSFWKFRAQ